MPSLILQSPGSREQKTVALVKRVISVGRSEDNDIVLQDPKSADTHALIQLGDRGFTIQSLEAGQPIEINGQDVRMHTLEHGDTLRIGDTTATFRFYDAIDPEEGGGHEELLQAYDRIVAFSARLLAATDLDTLLEALLDEVVTLTNADKGFLVMADGEHLSVAVARNVDRTNIEDAVSKLSDTILSEVIRSREPLVVSDALQDRNFSGSRSVVNLQLCSVMCVPLLHRGTLQGAIYVGNDNVVNLFTEDHLRLLQVFAAQAAILISNGLLLDELRVDIARLRGELEQRRFGSLIGSCDAMRQIYRRLEKVASTDVNVLILGETGTGKELIAQELHARSARASGPFVTINCGAIPENLLESELFGHTRGAFTGATQAKPGKFQVASGGTLFLDEIGEMPMALQVKILRAIQEKIVTRVGSTSPEKVDIRIVAATHRDLPRAIDEGSFREDLYYRLNVITLRLPPLRDRDDDIPLIAQYFLDRFTREYERGRRTFNRKALIAMRRHPWPGNIREMENLIRKAVILSERSVIGPEELGLQEEALPEIVPLAEAREAWQRDYILEVLARNEGNRTRTARDLGVDPRTIFRFLEREQEEDESPEPSPET